MIIFVNHQNRSRYENLLHQMHVQRRKVFVDQISWDLNVEDGLEIDSFDTEDTYYLLAADGNEDVLRGSVRLNPTIKPHLMSELFSGLCGEEVPRDHNTWEISRLCFNPALKDKEERNVAMREIVLSILECGLLFGWRRLTMVVGTALLPYCLRCGWNLTPLGIPKLDKDDLIAAFAISVSPSGLQAVRARTKIDRPVLQIPAEPQKFVA